MGDIVKLRPPPIATITQPNGVKLDIFAGDRVAMDDRGYTRVERFYPAGMAGGLAKRDAGRIVISAIARALRKK